MDKLEVKFRGSFSDRYNLIDINKTIQTVEFDKNTRNAIFNKIASIFNKIERSMQKQHFIKILYTQAFNKKVSEIPTIYSSSNYSLHKALKDVEQVIDNNPYHEILSLIEFLVVLSNQLLYETTNFENDFNQIFEENCVGYRFVNQTISPITDKVEIQEIETACKTSNKFQNASNHIQNALNALSNRENKDYKSCIHESISAIEATVNVIMGFKKTLGDALKEFEKKGYPIHPALKSAFEKMYGYTSDKDGIRHDFGNDSNVDFEEAKYMLVSCSAFMNYLIGISTKISQ